MPIQVLLLIVAAVVVAPAQSAPAQFDVTAAGAVGDGQKDNTAAFQKALDEAAKAGGAIVNVPTGQYRINGTLTIPGGVTLQGTFRTAPANDHEKRPRMDGSILLAYSGRGAGDGAPFITMGGSNATLAGFIITYPEWQQADVPPVPYPPTIYADYTANVAILVCCLLNSYEGIHFQNAARFLIRNIHGYPSFRGLYIDMCGDIGRVENCHFWPFGVAYKPDDPYCLWVNTKGVAFEFARTDWQYVINTFCFGYGVGYKFSETKNGSCNGNFVGLGADSCQRAVRVEQLQPAGLLITNGEFVGRWSSTDAVCLEIAAGAGDGKVSLNNCSFWGPIDHCIWSKSAKTQVTAIGTNFCNFNINNVGSPAIQIDGGKAIIQGNTFGEGETHIKIGPDVASAIITGNQASGGLIVENKAGVRTQMIANEASPVQWTKDALQHYSIQIGAQGDRPYLRKWHAQEPAVEWPNRPGTKRWSGADSMLVLPVQPKKAYTLTLDVYQPKYVIDPANGIYLGEKKLADFPQTEGPAIITCPVSKSEVAQFFQNWGSDDTQAPASSKPRFWKNRATSDKSGIALTIRVKGWKPKDLAPESNDTRTLGIGLRSVEMKASGASGKVFNANTGTD